MKAITPIKMAYLITLSFSAIQMIFYVTIPYIARATGVSESAIIGSVGLGSMLLAFGGPFWSSKSDVLGRGKILKLGLIGLGLSFTALSSAFLFKDLLSENIKIVLIYSARIFFGLLACSLIPVSQALQLDILGKNQTSGGIKVLTKNSMCLNIGKILGPILILTQTGSFEYLFYLGTAWIWILAFFTNKVMGQMPPHQKKGHEKKTKQGLIDFYKEQWGLWKILVKEATLPILLALVFTSFIGIIHSFFGVHLKTHFNMTAEMATRMMAQVVLGISLMAVVFQKLGLMLFGGRTNPRVLVGGIGLCAGSFLLHNSHSIPMIWFSVTLLALGIAYIPPAYLALAGQSKKQENVFGKKIALASVAHSLGYAFGALLMSFSLKLKIISETTIIIGVSLLIFALVYAIIAQAREERSLQRPDQATT